MTVTDVWACILLGMLFTGVLRLLKLHFDLPQIMPEQKKCHFCQSTKGPWAVWKIHPDQPSHERVPGLDGGVVRKHRLCKECHAAQQDLSKLCRTIEKDTPPT